ncbi:MAG: hypothetical protein H6658_20945 [Ardenticatenaceae bacterium]|nr:hypothetical protein [Ardenticatenaceae bacterium]
MPTLRIPHSDIGRLTFLRTAAQTATKDHLNGLVYITPDTLRELNEFLNIFDLAFLKVSAAVGERSREVEESEAAMAELKEVLDDLWEVLRRRVRRHNEPAGVLRFYGLDVDGQPPSLDDHEDWLELAEQVIVGDGQAVGAGFATAVCPSVAELQAALESARKELADVTPAERELDRAQTAVLSLRQQADNLILDIIEELRFHTRKEDPASQRHLLRTYGANYRYQPGEVRDLDDVEEEE